MRTTLAAALILASMPALGAECFYSNANGHGRLVFEGDHLTLHGEAGEVERCGLNETPDGLTFATCESGWEAEYILGSSTPEGTENDILGFYGAIWYRHCDST